MKIFKTKGKVWGHCLVKTYGEIVGYRWGVNIQFSVLGRGASIKVYWPPQIEAKFYDKFGR